MTASPVEPRAEPPDVVVAPGTVLAGKYRVEGSLGVGGMGVVVAAKHLQLDRTVALKILRVSLGQSPSVRKRFSREGRAVARIKSEHIAQILDVDELEDGSPYLVMEYLRGGDVAAEIKRRGPLPVVEAISIMLQACEAVGAAHAAGVVHRDIKPSNLFLAENGDGTRTVKVLDFGISKVSEPATPSSEDELGVTTAFEALGSPVYMSPEQMRSSRDVDARTDVWSLGVTLFKLLTGQAPFPGKTMTDLCARVLVDPTPSVRALRPEVPEGLQATVERCLEKEPADRFQSVSDLALALAEHASPEDVELARRIPSVSPPKWHDDSQDFDTPGSLDVETVIGSSSGTEGSSPATESKPAGGVRPWKTVSLVVVVAVAAGATVFALRGPRAAVAPVDPRVAATDAAAATPPTTSNAAVARHAPSGAVAVSPPPVIAESRAAAAGVSARTGPPTQPRAAPPIPAPPSTAATPSAPASPAAPKSPSKPPPGDDHPLHL